MRLKKQWLFSAIIVILVLGVVFLSRGKGKEARGGVEKEISPTVGSIKTTISCTGTVLPKNRLEVKPPVNGRIEHILVTEGEKVKAGQTLAQMSSTERAALLDAARGQGEEVLKYWEETYKPIPLPAPIDAEVIVATTQPGQTVTTAEAVVVLSDRLIVRSQVDETDIGKIKPGMKATIVLDAYPDAKIKASVDHIYYESQTVNNVTIYNVDLAPEEVPSFFRSGMNATVNFIIENKEDALLIPVDAVHTDRVGSYCFVKQDNSSEPAKVRLTIGISDDKNVEVLSGLTEKDRVIETSKKYSLPTAGEKRKNPFMPGH